MNIFGKGHPSVLATKHSIGECYKQNGDLSKALIMGFTLMTAPQPIDVPMNYQECWSPLDMRRVFVRYIPLVNALCEALTYHFWVSLTFFL